VPFVSRRPKLRLSDEETTWLQHLSQHSDEGENADEHPLRMETLQVALWGTVLLTVLAAKQTGVGTNPAPVSAFKLSIPASLLSLNTSRHERRMPSLPKVCQNFTAFLQLIEHTPLALKCRNTARTRRGAGACSRPVLRSSSCSQSRSRSVPR